jgi:hypothetical protein
MSNLEQFKRHIAEQAAKKGIPEEQALRKFKSFDEYTAEASDKLGLPPDADQCRAYASIKLSLDKVLEDQMVNKPIDPADHLRLIEALQRLLPQEPAREHTVEIQLVERPVGIFNCSACGHQNRVEPLELPPPIERVTRDVTPIAAVTDASITDEIKHPDMITPPPVKRVRHNEQPEEPPFSMCTIGMGIQTSDRWTR